VLEPLPDGGIRLHLSQEERALLVGLTSELGALLEGERDDPSLRRLFPPAYDDEADERAYRELTSDSLLDGRREALELLSQTADRERLSAEEADAITGSRGRWSIAAANVEVADGYGAQHLLHQPVKVAATNNRWQVRGEFVFKSDEILTMMIRIVKPVAHDPHRFMEHLTPFLGRIDTNFHLTEVLPALVWFCGSVS